MTIKEKDKLTYSVPEAAAVLGVSKPHMYEIVHRKDFPVFRSGTRLLIPRKMLEEWVEAQAREGLGVSL